MSTPNETPDHPLTETAAAALWDAHREPGVLPLSEQGRLYAGNQIAMLRAAFNAGQKYQDDLEDDTIRNIMKDVHHLRVERDTADNVVADLTAKVARVEALADRLFDAEADPMVSRGGVFISRAGTASLIRAALNGENR